MQEDRASHFLVLQVPRRSRQKLHPSRKSNFISASRGQQSHECGKQTQAVENSPYSVCFIYPQPGKPPVSWFWKHDVIYCF